MTETVIKIDELQNAVEDDIGQILELQRSTQGPSSDTLQSFILLLEQRRESLHFISKALHRGSKREAQKIKVTSGEAHMYNLEYSL